MEIWEGYDSNLCSEILTLGGDIRSIRVHKGYRVRVEVPEYGSRFPSTDFGKNRGKSPTFQIFKKQFQSLIFIYKTDTGQFAMPHGSYDSNLGSEILTLAGDIRSRSWPNIGGTYGI
jgi:hypothetical protein